MLLRRSHEERGHRARPRKDETCPLSTGEKTRRIQLVRGEGGAPRAPAGRAIRLERLMCSHDLRSANTPPSTEHTCDTL